MSIIRYLAITKSNFKMTHSLQEVFFYGLFMDEVLLLKKGVNPQNPRKASLANYGLRIGERASLIPADNEQSYGIIMSLNTNDLSLLYSDKSVADYVPEIVSVTTEEKETVDVTCYNLPVHLMKGSNSSYAKSLYVLAQSLNFPLNYLKQIEAFVVSH